MKANIFKAVFLLSLAAGVVLWTAQITNPSSASGTVSNCATLNALGIFTATGTTISCDANVTDNGTLAVAEAFNQGTAAQTTWAAAGGLSKYRGTSTGGNGLVFVLGTPSNVTNQTASQTTVNLVASTPSGGQYEIQAYVNERTACATPGPGQVVVTFNWTDALAARNTSITLPFDSASTTSSQKFVNVPLFANNASAITYTTTYTACTTGTGAYDLHASVAQLQ